MMYHLVWGVLLNVLGIMMRYATEYVNVCLPYSMVLILVFEEFRVPLRKRPLRS